MKKRWMIIPALGIFLTALVVGSFLDLEISKGLADPTNMFGIILAAVGEITAYGLIGFICGCFFNLAFKTKPHILVKIALIGLAIGGVCGAAYFQGTAFTSTNAFGSLYPQMDKLYISLPIGFAMVVPFAIGGYFVGKFNLNKESLVILFVLLGMILVVLLGINVIKVMAYRPRFRYIQTTSDVYFKNWWEFTFKKGVEHIPSENKKSFPSGHTGCAVFAMALVYLPYFFPKLRQQKYIEEITFFAGLGYAVLIAFSRVLVGAHFLSDVAFSGIFFLVTLYCGDVVLKAIEKKLEQKKVAE